MHAAHTGCASYKPKLAGCKQWSEFHSAALAYFALRKLLHGEEDHLAKRKFDPVKETKKQEQNKARQEFAKRRKTEALTYAQLGWQVVRFYHPKFKGDTVSCSCSEKGNCSSIGKHPHTIHGYKSGTIREETIEEWFTKVPKDNIGIVTGRKSNLVVLDIDPRNGGNESLKSLIDQYGELPKTVTVKTGGGGLHYYFAYPAGRHVKSSVGLLDGIDLCSDGKCVVAPSSTHQDGKDYTFIVPPNNANALAPLPSWLIALVDEKAEQRKSLHRSPTKILQSGDDIKHGKRDKTLLKIALGKLYGGEGTKKTVEDLIQINAARCKPPLPITQVEKIVKSATKYVHPAKPNKQEKRNLYVILPAGCFDDDKLKENDFRVLGVLASHRRVKRNDDGTEESIICPKESTIAEILDIAVKTVSRCKGRLKERGYLTWKAGKHNLSYYTIHHADGEPLFKPKKSTDDQ